jgi:hypothetical protein
MSYAVLDALTRMYEESAKEVATAGATYPVNPKATAVLHAFYFGKLKSRPEVADIPLAALVTPSSLPTWQAIFDDPEQVAQLVERLRHHGLNVPRVRPQTDGSVVILLPWQHPDQDEVEWVLGPREVFAHAAYLELIEEPDDWRVSRID